MEEDEQGKAAGPVPEVAAYQAIGQHKDDRQCHRPVFAMPDQGLRQMRCVEEHRLREDRPGGRHKVAQARLKVYPEKELLRYRSDEGQLSEEEQDLGNTGEFFRQVRTGWGWQFTRRQQVSKGDPNGNINSNNGE